MKLPTTAEAAKGLGLRRRATVPAVMALLRDCPPAAGSKKVQNLEVSTVTTSDAWPAVPHQIVLLARGRALSSAASRRPWRFSGTQPHPQSPASQAALFPAHYAAFEASGEQRAKLVRPGGQLAQSPGVISSR